MQPHLILYHEFEFLFKFNYNKKWNLVMSLVFLNIVFLFQHLIKLFLYNSYIIFLIYLILSLYFKLIMPNYCITYHDFIIIVKIIYLKHIILENYLFNFLN